MSEFQGIPKAGLKFMGELAENNEHEWFEANKQRYQDAVLAPSLALVAALGARLKSISKDIISDRRSNGSGSLMRIHRDTRFSKDKTPYNPYITMMFWEGAGKKTESPAFGLRFDARSGGLMVGMYGFPKPMLAAYREAVLDTQLGAELDDAIDAVQQAGSYDISGEHYKRVPSGLPADHPRAELLRYAGLYAHGPTLRGKDLTSPALVDLCYAHFEKMAPLQRWLVKINPNK